LASSPHPLPLEGFSPFGPLLHPRVPPETLRTLLRAGFGPVPWATGCWLPRGCLNWPNLSPHSLVEPPGLLAAVSKIQTGAAAQPPLGSSLEGRKSGHVWEKGALW